MLCAGTRMIEARVPFFGHIPTLGKQLSDGGKSKEAIFWCYEKRHRTGYPFLLSLSGRANGVPLCNKSSFRFAIEEAKLGTLTTFHMLLRILASHEDRCIAHAVIKLSWSADRFGIFQTTGFDTACQGGFVVSRPGISAGSLSLSGKGSEAEKGKRGGFHREGFFIVGMSRFEVRPTECSSSV